MKENDLHSSNLNSYLKSKASTYLLETSFISGLVGSVLNIFPYLPPLAKSDDLV